VYIGISVLAPNSPALYTHRGIPAHIYFLWPGPGLEIPFDAQWGEFERERMRRGQPKKVLPVGKLPLEHLRSLLRHLPKHDPRLLIGPQIGEDAAVIDAGDRYLVVTTDPITFATDHIGRYAVHVNANDIAVLGARPLWFFVVMLLPESRTTPELAETIMASTARFWSVRCSARSPRLALCGRLASLSAI
jgi:hypothetical protein